MKKEKFYAGEKVFLIHLNESAIVKRADSEELLYVETDGMEFPVFAEDVSRNFPSEPINESQEKNNAKSAGVKYDSKYVPGGKIFIAFIPLIDKTENTIAYEVYFLNDTHSAISLNYRFYSGDSILFALKQNIGSPDFMLLHTVEADILNQSPAVWLTAQDELSGMSVSISQKIKPQNFFNKEGMAPLLNKLSYLYEVKLMSAVAPVEAQPISVDAELLKRLILDSPEVKDKDAPVALHEIDLHLDSLDKNYANGVDDYALHFQLMKFQQALDNAIVSGTEKFYAIHGVGSGKLRREIHKLLASNKSVRSFNNEYHPRYGFGATEIILK